VLAPTQERILEAKLEVINLLETMGLRLHPEKTQVTNFERGFRFLGHGFLDNAIFPVDANEVSLRSALRKIKGVMVEKRNGKYNRKKKEENPKALTSAPTPIRQDTNVLGNVKNLSSHLYTTRREVLNDRNGSDIGTLHQPFLAEVETELSQPREVDNSVVQKNSWHREMAAIYLIEQGTTIYKEYQRFIIYVSEKPKLEVPIREVQQILVFGNIQLSTPVMQVCLREQIAVVFLSQSGRYHGHLWSSEFRDLDQELVQVRRWGDAAFQFQVSQAIVYGKLMNSKQLLLRFNRKRKLPDVERAIIGINQDIEALEFSESLDRLRGYEGIGAARYFPALGQLITNSRFEFSLRNRQPPTDPVNSLLSFGYTLLFNNVLGFIIAEGLSPYWGNFHYGERQKPYLAFDLMEEMRSVVVDSLVVKIINNSVFKPQDFDTVPSTGGVYLNQSARRVFLKQFETRMNEEVSHPDVLSKVSYRQAIQLQVRRYKQSLLSGVPYEAFLRAM